MIDLLYFVLERSQCFIETKVCRKIKLNVINDLQSKVLTTTQAKLCRWTVLYFSEHSSSVRYSSRNLDLFSDISQLIRLKRSLFVFKNTLSIVKVLVWNAIMFLFSSICQRQIWWLLSDREKGASLNNSALQTNERWIKRSEYNMPWFCNEREEKCIV